MKNNGKSRVDKRAFKNRMASIYATHLFEFWQQGKDLQSIVGKAGGYPDTLTWDEFRAVCLWLNLDAEEPTSGLYKSFQNSMLFASYATEKLAKQLHELGVSRFSVSRVCSRLQDAKRCRQFLKGMAARKLPIGGRRLKNELDTISPRGVRLPSTGPKRRERYVDTAENLTKYNDELCKRETVEVWDNNARDTVLNATYELMESASELCGRLINDKTLSARIVGEIIAAIDEHNRKQLNKNKKVLKCHP